MRKSMVNCAALVLHRTLATKFRSVDNNHSQGCSAAELFQHHRCYLLHPSYAAWGLGMAVTKCQVLGSTNRRLLPANYWVATLVGILDATTHPARCEEIHTSLGSWDQRAHHTASLCCSTRMSHRWSCLWASACSPVSQPASTLNSLLQRRALGSLKL